MRVQIVCGLVAVSTWATAQAAPLAGCYTVTPPGGWSERLQGGHPGMVGNEIRASDGASYSFFGARIAEVQPDSTGTWDWLTRYDGGTLVLTNLPGAPWYTPCDPAGEFVVPMPEVMVKTRSTRFAGTTNEGRLEFELSGQHEWIDILATYAGLPAYEPDGADVIAHGQLATARVRIGMRVAVEVRGGHGRGPDPINVKSHGVIPVMVLGTKQFDVRTIDPASVRLECVPALRWSLVKACRDRTPDLVLLFDTQAVVGNLPPVHQRQVIPLILTGELKSGEPISGSDDVIVLGAQKMGDRGHNGDCDRD
jgi:hypothetical protein